MLQPPTVRKHTQGTSYVNKDLSSCPFAFMRHDAVKKPLQAPCDGPFKVFQRTNKHFTLDISGKKKVVSLDRLKPAYVDTSPIPDTSSQTLTAQSHLLTSTSQPPPQHHHHHLLLLLLASPGQAAMFTGLRSSHTIATDRSVPSSLGGGG